MDLSHMIGLWLVGQSSGVAPGGVAVLYAPAGGAGGGARVSGKRGVGVYPFSGGAWCVGGGGSHGVAAQSRGLGAGGRPGAGNVPGAGLALIGELEYGAEGLEGFVPRLWSAVGVGGWDLGVGIWELGSDDDMMLGSAVNRGAGSIGLSEHLRFVDRFDSAGVLGRARVVGFVERPGGEGVGAAHRQDACATLVQTSEDVAVADFPVMFGKLVDYLRFAVSAQVAGNGYDDLAGVLAKCDRPTHAVVVVGLGGGSHGVAAQSRRLGAGEIPGEVSGEVPGVVAGDVCHSVVYDGGAVTLDEIEDALRGGGASDPGVLEGEGVSWLRREVVG